MEAPMKIPPEISEVMAIMTRTGAASPESLDALARHQNKIYTQIALMEYYRAVNDKKGQVWFV
jgi:hypothetical protein